MSNVTYTYLTIKTHDEKSVLFEKALSYKQGHVDPITDNGDPREGWEGMHEGCHVELQFQAEDLTEPVWMYLRLYSTQEKRYFAPERLLKVERAEPEGEQTEPEERPHIPPGTVTLEVPPLVFAEPSDWNIDVTLIEGGEIKREELFVAYGESTNSLLPLRIDEELEGLWELKLLIAPREADQFSAFEGYEVLVNPNKLGADILLKEPFKGKQWDPLALEVYSHVFTELISQIPAEVTAEETHESASYGSLSHFVKSLKGSIHLQANQELPPHDQLFLKVRFFLENGNL